MVDLWALVADSVVRIEQQTATWKKMRRKVTLEYGYYTFALCLVLLLLIPYWDRIANAISGSFYNRLLRRLHAVPFRHKYLTVDFALVRLVAVLTLLLTLLSFLQTAGDFGFIAARLGRVPTYCLPTVLFLTLRPSPLPRTLYLRLVPLHKWLSRLVVLQSFLHTVMYLIDFTNKGTMHKILRFDNLNGIVAMTAFIIIAVTSLPKFRRSVYRIFFVNHYICTWVVVITLYFHVRPGIPYLTLLNVLILLYQIYYRFKVSAITMLRVHEVSENTLIVELPNSSIVNKSELPGCHIRMIQFDSNWLKRFYNIIIAPEQHPYTLATLPVDETQKLIVRKGDFKLNDRSRYMVSGSYLPFLRFIRPLKNANPKSLMVNTNVQKCLIVVGGSAISFAIPILRVMSYNGTTVKIIWVIRDHEDLKDLDYFKNALVSDDCIDIFITGKYSKPEMMHFKEAVSELHRRRKELEMLEERRMMGFDEPDSPVILPESVSSSSPKKEKCMGTSANTKSHSGSNSGRSGKSLETLQTSYDSSNVHEGKDTSAHELDDIHIVSDGPDTDFDDTRDSLEPPGIDPSVDNTRKKSRISLRGHSHSAYTYAEENKFENVDLELNGIPSNGDRDRGRPVNRRALPGKSSERSALCAKAAPSYGTYRSATLVSSPDRSSSPDMGYYPTFAAVASDKGGSSMGGGSSELYDDLADYWVLKGLSCKIDFGRPVLGIDYYNWCTGSSCIGPMIDINTGNAICYNTLSDGPTQRERDAEEELYNNATFIQDRKVRFRERGGKPNEKIWVLGAGPKGLVDKVRFWADECGFCFHAECFSM